MEAARVTGLEASAQRALAETTLPLSDRDQNAEKGMSERPRLLSWRAAAAQRRNRYSDNRT
jgi:hypothetical protein